MWRMTAFLVYSESWVGIYIPMRTHNTNAIDTDGELDRAPLKASAMRPTTYMASIKY